MTTPQQDIAKAERFFARQGLNFTTVKNRDRAVAELAHEFFVERTNGRMEEILEMRVTMGDIAQKAMKHISDECLEVLVNHNGRNMVLQRDAPRKKKKKG